MLADHLTGCAEARVKVAVARARRAVEGVMNDMIEIATGHTVVRGAIPIAAAKFVFELMKTRSAWRPA